MTGGGQAGNGNMGLHYNLQLSSEPLFWKQELHINFSLCGGFHLLDEIPLDKF